MSQVTQANRPLQLDTPLGPDVLLVEGMAGEERVSAPYAFTLDLISTEPSIDAADMLRKPVLVTVLTPDGGERLLHGLVGRFSQGDRSEDGFTTYQALVVPWVWFLSLSTDCRVYQNMSVLDIAEQLFGELGYADYQNRCVAQPPKREYCVQYRESHLDFIARLLESEGIFYYFEHSESKHVLVLADGAGSVGYCRGPRAARWMPSGSDAWPDANVVRGFRREQGLNSGKVTLTDYDPLNPSLHLLRTVAADERPSGVAQPEEVYDYPGGYTTPDDGERYARLRLEQREAMLHVVRGESNCRGFQSGCRFDLAEHYRQDANRPYYLLEVKHTARVGGYRSAYSIDSFDYENSFVAVPHDVPFRPPPVTPKPVMRGVQTAVVVGPAGEEIYVDKHGRVKVQFHWDRTGRRDENSSCWVRVSTAWAGKGWGSLSIPRIGQEVIVDFLEGDPDRPIITGRVFNAEQGPPYDPAKGGAVSGLRSKTHKGSGFNEMSMDDTAGKEKITIHAQFDMSTTVQHDETHTVHNNRTTAVSVDDAVTVGSKQTVSVGADQTTSVGANQTLTVAAKQTESVGADRSVTVTSNDTLGVGAKLAITAGSEVTITVGAASLTMKADGTINLSGVNVTVNGTKIAVRGKSEAVMSVTSQSVKCTAESTEVAGAAVKSAAKGVNEITGSTVKLN